MSGFECVCVEDKQCVLESCLVKAMTSTFFRMIVTLPMLHYLVHIPPGQWG